jgi:hypothetical protein
VNAQLWLWFAIGVALGVLLVRMLRHFVEKLNPGEADTGVPSFLTGCLARYLLIGIALVLAIRQDARAGVLLIAGVWIGRWGMLLIDQGIIGRD